MPMYRALCSSGFSVITEVGYIWIFRMSSECVRYLHAIIVLGVPFCSEIFTLDTPGAKPSSGRDGVLSVKGSAFYPCHSRQRYRGPSADMAHACSGDTLREAETMFEILSNGVFDLQHRVQVHKRSYVIDCAHHRKQVEASGSAPFALGREVRLPNKSDGRLLTQAPRRACRSKSFSASYAVSYRRAGSQSVFLPA